MLSTEFLFEIANNPERSKLYGIAWQTGIMPPTPMINSIVPTFMRLSTTADLKQIVQAKKVYPANPQLAIDVFFHTGPSSGKQIDLKTMFGSDYNAVKKLHDAYWKKQWEKNTPVSKVPANAYGKKTPIVIANALPKIAIECSDILKLYAANPDQFFYRGIGSLKPLLKGASYERESLHTPDEIHQNMSAAMQELGFTAVRNNSIFATSDLGEASQYADGDYSNSVEGEGAVYIFLPVNGYQFSWSPNVRDFYADWEGGNINLEDDEDWTVLVKKLKYTNKRLDKALHSDCEIMFVGKYYMINADYRASLDKLLS